MSERAITEDVAPGQISLDEGNFFYGRNPLIFLVERAA